MTAPFETAASLAAAAPEAALCLLALVLLLVEAFLPRRRDLLPYIALLGLLGALGLALRAPGGAAFGGALVSDPLALLGRLVVLAATAVAVAVLPSCGRSAGLARPGEVAPLLVLAAAGASILAAANDLVVAVLGLETAAVSTYAAIASLRSDDRALEGAVKYLAAGAIGSALLLVGLSYLFGAAGSTRYLAIRDALGTDAVALAGAALFLAGLLFKVGAAPFHAWVPDAYEGAPTPVTAFMASAIKAAAAVALLRAVAVPLRGAAVTLAPILVGLSAVTMVWGNAAALRQESPKRMLAYSAIAHAGYLLVGVAAAAGGGGAAGLGAAAFYVAAYAPLALGAFLAVAAVEGASAGGLDAFRGLARRSPGTALAVAVLLAALTGLPPTLGFAGKLLLFLAAVEAGLVGLALVAVAASVVSAAYYLRVVRAMYADPSPAAEGAGAPEAPPLVGGAVALAALVALVVGLLPGPLWALAARAAEALVR